MRGARDNFHMLSRYHFISLLFSCPHIWRAQWLTVGVLSTDSVWICPGTGFPSQRVLPLITSVLSHPSWGHTNGWHDRIPWQFRPLCWLSSIFLWSSLQVFMIRQVMTSWSRLLSWLLSQSVGARVPLADFIVMSSSQILIRDWYHLCIFVFLIDATHLFHLITVRGVVIYSYPH